MLVPLSWLSELVPLGTDPTDAAALRALEQVLNDLGLVVEGVEQVAGGPEGVVLSRVLEIRPIEGLDRVRLTLVDAGDGKPLEVACGAWNFEIGDVVPLATTGTRLPDGRVIERRPMRNVVSNGMLCSPVELGAGDDGGGLLVLASTGGPDAPLPPGLTLGAPLNDVLSLHPDAVFDLAIEANRPDCLCIAGVARDLGGKLGLPLNLPVPVIEESGPPAAELAAVKIAAPELCYRLTARGADRCRACCPRSAWWRGGFASPACGRSTRWSTPPTTPCSSSASRPTPTTSTVSVGTGSSPGPRAGGGARHPRRRTPRARREPGPAGSA